MNDKPIIMAGLLIAMLVLTSPIWYSLAAGDSGAAPDLTLPDGECVEDADYMRGRHMDLLEEWREEVVRDGNKEQYTSRSGKKYEKSLTKTCLLQCHITSKTSKDDFCGKCHDYADVQPTCWDCHVENPKPIGE
jgi:hypothetical protein